MYVHTLFVTLTFYQYTSLTLDLLKLEQVLKRQVEMTMLELDMSLY